MKQGLESGRSRLGVDGAKKISEDLAVELCEPVRTKNLARQQRGAHALQWEHRIATGDAIRVIA
ncbi:hypothetical protein D3C72_2138600 [compost metagenome]